MTFERPDLLVLIPIFLGALGVGVGIQWRRGVRLVSAYGGPVAARRLLRRSLETAPTARASVLFLATVGLVVAAAGPTRQDSGEVEPATPVDLIVAIDVSHSMTATDVEPSRITRAREALDRIIDAGVADRLSLTLFADWPYGLVPLTDDADVVSFFSHWVAPDLVSTRDQGTSIAALIGYSRNVWEARPRNEGQPIVLIISDGEAHGLDPEVLDSVAVASEAGIRVWTAGIGTAEGAPLFVAGSEGAPLLDADGRPVLAEYGPELLRAMADRGSGEFFDVSSDAGMRSLIGSLRRQGGPGDGPGDVPTDLVFWLVLSCIVLLVADAVLDSGVRHRRRSPT
jgi:Ca-activated chloride channel homolog